MVQANAWYSPGMGGKSKGTRSMASYDEDSITMGVEAARDELVDRAAELEEERARAVKQLKAAEEAEVARVRGVAAQW